MVVKTVLGSTILVGEFTTHFGAYFSGDGDVHWGYDLDLDPWPCGCVFFGVGAVFWWF